MKPKKWMKLWVDCEEFHTHTKKFLKVSWRRQSEEFSASSGQSWTRLRTMKVLEVNFARGSWLTNLFSSRFRIFHTFIHFVFASFKNSLVACVLNHLHYLIILYQSHWRKLLDLVWFRNISISLKFPMKIAHQYIQTQHFLHRLLHSHTQAQRNFFSIIFRTFLRFMEFWIWWSAKAKRVEVNWLIAWKFEQFWSQNEPHFW